MNSKYPYSGASVDGIVSCPKCDDGIVEIKCPYKWQHNSPIDACQDAGFCCENVNDQLLLKSNHHYYYQVMGQMAITELQWADFVIWTRRGISVQKIKFCGQTWGYMQEKLHAFYLYAFVPEVFTTRVKTNKALYP